MIYDVHRKSTEKFLFKFNVNVSLAALNLSRITIPHLQTVDEELRNLISRGHVLLFTSSYRWNEQSFKGSSHDITDQN